MLREFDYLKLNESHISEIKHESINRKERQKFFYHY